MDKEEFLKAIENVPKTDSINSISSYNSINIEDLANAVNRLKKVPTYDELLKENQKLKENYERIYNENCILREKHNISDIDLLDENYRLKQVIDKAIEFTNKNWGTWCTHHIEYMTELQNILKEGKNDSYVRFGR